MSEPNGIPYVLKPVITLDELETPETVDLPEAVDLPAETDLSEEGPDLALDVSYGPSEHYTEEDVQALAKTMYGEARGVSSLARIAAVSWCILNRVDAGYAATPYDVATADGAFQGYDADNPCDGIFEWLARDVLDRWAKEKNGETEVGRTLPKEYLYFLGDGQENHYTTEFLGGNTWDWSLPDPYDMSETLFIGNSLTEGIRLCTGSEASFVCETGIALNEMVKKAESDLQKTKFQTAIICMGTNELGSYTEERFKEAYRELVAEVRENEPDARVICMTIPPVSANQDAKGNQFNNENVKKYNRYLLELCQEDGLSYIDSAGYFGDVLDYDWTPDGIHMAAEIYRGWYDYIIQRILK